MWLNILQCTDHTTENYPAQNVSSIKVGKPHNRFMYLSSGPIVFDNEIDNQDLSSGIWMVSGCSRLPKTLQRCPYTYMLSGPSANFSVGYNPGS